MHRFLEVFLYREWTADDMDTIDLQRLFRGDSWTVDFVGMDGQERGGRETLGNLGNILVYFLGIFMTG